MGLFSSNKLEQPPVPKMAIHLSTPAEHMFKPGDILSGYISLRPALSIVPQALEVSLFGHEQVWYRTSSTSNNTTTYYHWRDNAPLFEVVENVLPRINEGNQIMAGGVLQLDQTYTFPFSFRLPAGTGNTRVGQYKDDNDERWTVQPHTLPPTILHASSHGNGGDKPDWAKVEYGVRARLICPGVGMVEGKVLTDIQVCAPIQYRPLNPFAQELTTGPLSVLRHPKRFEFQSSTLTGQEASAIGFRQSMRDRFSSSTPKLDFEAALEIPDLLASHSEFRFRASFAVLHKTHSVTKIPPVTFRVLKLHLLDFTFVRAPLDPDAINMLSGKHRSNKYETMPPPYQAKQNREKDDYQEKKTRLNSVPECITVELEPAPPGYTESDLALREEKKEPGSRGEKGEASRVPEATRAEQARTCEVWFASRVPGYTCPSFKSFNLSRVYRIKIKLGVEVGMKQFVLEAESHVRYMG